MQEIALEIALFRFRKHSVIFVYRKGFYDFLSCDFPGSDKGIGMIILAVIHQQINDDFRLTNFLEFFVRIDDLLYLSEVLSVVRFKAICNTAVQTYFDGVKQSRFSCAVFSANQHHSFCNV